MSTTLPGRVISLYNDFPEFGLMFTGIIIVFLGIGTYFIWWRRR